MRIYHRAENQTDERCEYEEINLSNRETLMDLLSKGILLAITTSSTQQVIIGLTHGKFWRFNPFDGEGASTLTIFENEEELRLILKRLMSPKLRLIKMLPQPDSQHIESNKKRAML